ncbi:MAG: hypothetical protein L6264_01465 [Weeksellaceae bacterium]|nr:hypothetical protein [Bacteroidota bacterium]MCG2779590.1 hypothetical protein [Weeksellaceae bacterium]
MKKLDLIQMENLNGAVMSSDCGWAIAGLVVTFAGLCITTTPVGGAIGVAGMITAGVGMKACN